VNKVSANFEGYNVSVSIVSFKVGIKPPEKTTMSVSPSYLTKFLRLARDMDLGYNERPKAEFHRMAKKILKEVADRLGLQASEYSIRSNVAGIAVSGEVTLHADWVYIQLGQSCWGPDFGFMYRSCKGQRDYTGGQNRWMRWDALLDLDRACDAFRACRAAA